MACWDALPSHTLAGVGSRRGVGFRPLPAHVAEEAVQKGRSAVCPSSSVSESLFPMSMSSLALPEGPIICLVRPSSSSVAGPILVITSSTGFYVQRALLRRVPFFAWPPSSLVEISPPHSSCSVSKELVATLRLTC